MYFQLYPSTHPIEETEYGLLPTPCTMDCMTNPPRQITESGRIISNQGHNGSAPLKDLAMNGLLPTPKTQDERGNVFVNRGKFNLTDEISKMLPTPTTRDYKGGKTQATMRKRKDRGNNAITLPDCFAQISGTSQLNPRFVMEMMGFPPNWTILPFLNGETNQSKQEEMQ
jgi:hypothetical protein